MRLDAGGKAVGKDDRKKAAKKRKPKKKELTAKELVEILTDAVKDQVDTKVHRDTSSRMTGYDGKTEYTQHDKEREYTVGPFDIHGYGSSVSAAPGADPMQFVEHHVGKPTFDVASNGLDTVYANANAGRSAPGYPSAEWSVTKTDDHLTASIIAEILRKAGFDV